MATKKERLANKREAQKAETAKIKAQQEKERLTKEKDDQDETKKLDAKIQQLDKDIRALAEAASDYRSKQEFLSFRVESGRYWGGPDDLPRGHFVGKGSMAVNEEYKTNFVVKMDKLRLQRENALNERYPKRKEERHERKKENEAQRAFWSQFDDRRVVEREELVARFSFHHDKAQLIWEQLRYQVVEHIKEAQKHARSLMSDLPIEASKYRSSMDKNTPIKASKTLDKADQKYPTYVYDVSIYFKTLSGVYDIHVGAVDAETVRNPELMRRTEEQRGNAMAIGLAMGDSEVFEEAHAAGKGHCVDQLLAVIDLHGRPGKEKVADDVEVVLRKSVGWIMIPGQAVYVRCYHSRGTECTRCDCTGDGGTRESSTKWTLSDRAQALLKQGKLVIKDGEAKAQQRLADMGARLGSRVVANPFGFAGVILRETEYGMRPAQWPVE